MPNPHMGDVGTIFQMSIKDQDGQIVSLNEGDPIFLDFLKPDGTTVSQNAELSGDGEDGNIEYTIVDGDLDQTGLWHY